MEAQWIQGKIWLLPQRTDLDLCTFVTKIKLQVKVFFFLILTYNIIHEKTAQFTIFPDSLSIKFIVHQYISH